MSSDKDQIAERPPRSNHRVDRGRADDRFRRQRRHPKRSGGASARHSTQPNPARRRMAAPGQPRSSSRWIQQSPERVYPPRWRGRNQGWCFVRSNLEGEHIINDIQARLRWSPLMPEIVADPPSSSCFRLFSALGIAEYQWLSPDLFLLRARGAGVLRQSATSPSARACGSGGNFVRCYG